MATHSCRHHGRTMEDLGGDVVADRDERNDPDGVGRPHAIRHSCLGQPTTSERFQTIWGLAWLQINDLGDFLLPGQVPPECEKAG